MQYVKIAKTTEFEDAWFKKVRLLARNVAIFKDTDGTFFATEISCKHQNWDLTTGKFEGHIVTCPRHGWVYNIRTGACLTHDSTRLRRYGLKIEGEDIYITLTPIEE
jgi:nitrite reductase/ring-hydroxylating ferredoxin subunit